MSKSLKYSKKSKRISLAAMFTAFTLLFLYLACILPVMRMSMYFLCSVFIMGLIVEEEFGFSWLLFVAVSLLSLLIMPDKLRALPYVLFFGHYGIGKYYIEKRIHNKIVAYVIKLLYFNAAFTGIYFLASSVLLADIPFELPVWAIWLIANAAFALYDFVFSKVTELYCNRIRKWLVK